MAAPTARPTQVIAAHCSGHVDVNQTTDASLSQVAPGTSDKGDGDPDHDENASGNVPYTTFLPAQKRMIIFLVAAAGFFSPFSAFIYFPALDSIASTLHVSIQLMNLTVTMYLVVQGIVPSVFGEISEHIGRRPVYLAVFVIYIVASVGLAVQNSYRALLALRMVQSAGSSGTIALAYGVVSDIAAPHERGGYVGIAHVGFNSAPSLGPVLGGVLAEKAGWKWIFWCLAILSGAVFILLSFLLPETSRKLVGNGCLHATGINQTLLERLRGTRARGTATQPDDQRMNTPRLRVPSLSPCLRLLLEGPTLILLLSNGVFYMKYSCVQASLAPLLQKTYQLSSLHVGLCYLAFGTSCALASYGVGRIADYDYRATARDHNLSIDRVKGDAILAFPVEKARLRSVWIYIFMSSTATLGYGWTLETKTHLAAPLAMQFIIGLAVTGIFNVLNTLVVDLPPKQPATASAAVSVTRCFLAATGVSVLQLLFDAIGPGWTFTFIAALCYSTVPFLWIERQKGWDWRLAKAGPTAQEAVTVRIDSKTPNENQA
jgi:multidrug resistance protein